MSDVKTYGIFLDSSYRIITPVKKKPINSIKEFTDFFGILNANNYHPNEISADMIAEYLLENIDDDLNKNDKSKAFNRMKIWYKKLQ